jgi:hypothetical protein
VTEIVLLFTVIYFWQLVKGVNRSLPTKSASRFSLALVSLTKGIVECRENLQSTLNFEFEFEKFGDDTIAAQSRWSRGRVGHSHLVGLATRMPRIGETATCSFPIAPELTLPSYRF